MTVYYKNGFSDDDGTGQPHFRYGAGFFETLLYDGKEIQHLERHTERLLTSCRDFGFITHSFPYGGIAERVIVENGLSGGSAKVNICHLAESRKEYSVFISASAYTPPPADKVFRLCVYPHVHDSYMSRYKTMNYMHFYMAKGYAEERGCDDSLLTDRDGFLLETSTAAAVFRKDGRYYIPVSENRLRSISLEIFCGKEDVTPAAIHMDDADKYEILIMNSLMGVRTAVIEKNSII